MKRNRIPSMPIEEFFDLKLKRANESLKELMKFNPNLKLREMTQEQKLEKVIKHHVDSTGITPLTATFHPSDLIELLNEMKKEGETAEDLTPERIDSYTAEKGNIRLLYDNKVQKGTIELNRVQTMRTTHELANELLKYPNIPISFSSSNVLQSNVKRRLVIREVKNPEGRVTHVVLESQDELDYIKHLKVDAENVSSWTSEKLQQAYDHYLLRYNRGDFKEAEESSINYQRAGINEGKIYSAIPFGFEEFQYMLIGDSYIRSRMMINMGGVLSSKGGEGTEDNPLLISILPNVSETDYKLGDLNY